MIIAIDGLDGSGKETLANSLKDALIDKYGYNQENVLIHSFPCYKDDSGRQIKQLLAGSGIELPPGDLKAYMTAAMFAYNRAEYVADMKTVFGAEVFEAKSMIHIFDRYWGSNVLYQGLGKSGEDLDQFIRLMRSLDESLNNPMPDRYYFLRHPYNVLRRRIDNRKSKSVDNDRYEMDTFLKSVFHLSEYLLDRAKPPINPIYNVILEGCTVVTRSEVQTIYMERSVQTLVVEILKDLTNNSLLGGNKND